MNPAISRRKALKGTTAALVTVAVGASTSVAAAQDVSWTATSAFGVQWEMTSRIVSRLPVSARYGLPIPVGQVIVGATCPGYFIEQVRQMTDMVAVGGSGECTITIVDARGLTAHATVGLNFPPTPFPDTEIDFTITGTAAIIRPLPLPLPRNRGPMRISLDPEALMTMSGWAADGSVWGEGIQVSLAMNNGQDPLLVTMDIR
ncbi:hypothetical protein JOF56_005870 [Kibdelosporangium banguiense]|uniref:Twin-arginine translocation signal domain-containing protein n=1 Tax=Kibdelosporangium banguiense TaxID=1365924 RepID=A0ABS4TM61_9PSEU|nr:hypothetical protein [Kibdelosporangium banguiense]MBP2325485.1 hypothetical protein [Kibdelosporangium banguiense]